MGRDRYKRNVADPQRLDALLVEQFLDSHAEPPAEITLDVDATDDLLHGRQEGRFFHGYYDCHRYLPLYVACGPRILCARRRTADRNAAEGMQEELERIVGQIRRRSRSRGMASGQVSRRYRDFRYRTRTSWSRKRRVVGKAEWLPGRQRGDSQRFVVTSLERGRIGRQPLYEQLHCARGDMENRIKEQQLDLFADSTSAATLRANQLRLHWALFAAALLAVVRKVGLAGTKLARAQCGTIRRSCSRSPRRCG